MQQQSQDRELDAAIAKLLSRAGAHQDPQTVAEFRTVAKSFGPEWQAVDMARDEKRYRMADALVCVEVLQRNIDNFWNGRATVRRISYRRRQALNAGDVAEHGVAA